jgi:hypothetical protein
VELIDIHPKAILRDNLHEQLKRGLATSFSFIGGTTSPLVSEIEARRRHTRHALGVACQGFGGVAASRGDETGLKGDLGRIQPLVQSLVASTRPLAALASGTAQVQERTVVGLCDRLKSLAHEIITDPVVADRHEQLTKRLSEKEQLSQEEVEAIVEPTTLPDYSHRLEEIRKEFHLPEQLETGSSKSTDSGRSGVFSSAIGSPFIFEK